MTIDLDELEKLLERSEEGVGENEYDLRVALRNNAPAMIHELRELRAANKALSGDYHSYKYQSREATTQIIELKGELSSVEAERDALRAEVEGLKDAYWKGRAVMGFDNDGAERCDVVDVPAMILDDCAEMRVTLDESYAENDALSAQLATAREAIQATVDLLESSRKAHSKGSPEYDALFIRREVGGALEEALKKTTKGGGS